MYLGQRPFPLECNTVTGLYFYLNNEEHLMLGRMTYYDSFVIPFWVTLNNRVWDGGSFFHADSTPVFLTFADCANGSCYCSRHIMKQMFPVFCCLLAIFFCLHTSIIYTTGCSFNFESCSNFAKLARSFFLVVITVKLVQSRALGRIYLRSSHVTKPRQYILLQIPQISTWRHVPCLCPR